MGTGYISDIGMCGESGGILGMDAQLVVKQLRTRMPIRFEPAKGAPRANGVIFDVNTSNGRVLSIERITF
jgi:calcineurin-like phosphoesterase